MTKMTGKSPKNPQQRPSAKERVQERRENRKADAFESQIKSREKRLERSLTEMLPYRDILNGVMILENGKAEVVFELNPKPMVFMSELQLQNAWRDIKGMLRTAVPEGERARYIIECAPVSSELIRRYEEAKGKTDHDIINELIGIRVNSLKRERMNGTMMAHRYFLTCTVPGVKHKPHTAFEAGDLKTLMKRAEEVRERLMRRMAALGYAPVFMNTQEVFALCRRYLNPELAGITPPRFVSEMERTYYPKEVLKQEGDIEIPSARRQMLSGHIENHRNQHLQVGGKLMKCMTIHDLPDDTYINSVDNVIRAMGGQHCYVIVDYHHEPYGPAIRKLGMQTRADDPDGELDQHFKADQATKVYARQRQELMNHLAETGEHIYRTSIALIIFGDNVQRINQAKEQAVQALSYLGNAAVVVGSLHNMPMYLEEYLPMGGGSGRYCFKVIETTVGDFVPLSAPWKGSRHPTSVFRNQLGAMTAIDFFDQECLSWNGIICGGMGAGKTFLAQSMIRDMIAENVRVIIIDRGFGYAPIIEEVGAPVISMSAGQNIRINPFQLSGTDAIADDKEITDIRTILGGMVKMSDNSEQRELENSLVTAAIQWAFRSNTSTRTDDDGNSIQVVGLTIMSDFVRALSNMDELNGTRMSADVKALALRLANRFSKWTGNSPEGRLVDGPTTIDLSERVILFETSGMDSNPELGRVAILLLTNMVLAEAMKDTSSNKALFIDEAWALLNEESAKSVIMNIARRSRRYGMAMYLMSQTVNDFLDMKDMLTTTSFFFLGKNCGAPDSIMKIPDMTDIGVEFQQSIGMSKGKYSEFLCMIRKQNSVEGDVIRVEAEDKEYFMFTTDRVEMEKRLNISEERGISLAAAAGLMAAARRA